MKKCKKKLFLVSNMFPSNKHVRYGIFVQNFEKAVEGEFVVKKMVLKKQLNPLLKLIGYIGLYLKIGTIIFRARRNDIIYVHFPLHLAPALWVLKFFRKRIVLNFHGSDLVFNSKLTKVLSVFLKPLIRTSLIVVPSNYYKEKIVLFYGLNSNKVYVYPSGGINTSVFCPLNKSNKDIFLLGFVSNFIESKGWRLLLLALKNIVKNNSIKNVELVMVGEGPDKHKIDDCLKTINIKYQVISSVSQLELASIYNSMSLFVFPTYQESLGLVGLEAMACGTPIVAGRVGGPMGYVEDEVNSFLFKAKDYSDLENKILQYYNLSSEAKERVRISGIKTAKLYDSVTVNTQLLSFLRGI